MKVRYAFPAQADLDQIYTYISENNQFAAERIKRQIKIDAELLGDFPFISRESDHPGIRVRKVRRYPYLIFYAVGDDVDSYPPRAPRRAAMALGRRRLNYPISNCSFASRA